MRSGVLSLLLPKWCAYASGAPVLMWIFSCRKRDQLSPKALLGTLSSEDSVSAGALGG